MNIYAKPGTKVVFTGEGGYIFDNAKAREKLTIGKQYTVKHIVVYDWFTHVYFVEEEGPFNSVLFEDVAEEGRNER